VVVGGKSAEREVSLKSGAAVPPAAALRRGCAAFDPAVQNLQALRDEGMTAPSSRCTGASAKDARCRARWNCWHSLHGSGVLARRWHDKWRTQAGVAGGKPARAELHAADARSDWAGPSRNSLVCRCSSNRPTRLQRRHQQGESSRRVARGIREHPA